MKHPMDEAPKLSEMPWWEWLFLAVMVGLVIWFAMIMPGPY